MTPDCSAADDTDLTYIFVLNHNGKTHLARSLGTVATCARGRSARIVVVDNASSDGSEEYVKANYPGIDVLVLPENIVLQAINVAVDKYRPRRFVFLVNDIVVPPDFLDLILPPLADDDVFAVSCHMVSSESDLHGQDAGQPGTSWRPNLRHGQLGRQYRLRGEELRADAPLRTFLAGGFSAYDGGKFRSLGGFDPIFLPFFSEDVDLSMRAWRAGYEILYEPRCVVLHDESAGTIAVKSADVQVIAIRNSVLWAWINLDGFAQLSHHALWFVARTIKATVKLDRTTIRANLRACLLLPAARRSRNRAKHQSILSAVEAFGKIGEAFPRRLAATISTGPASK